jgi:GNAT superfamily N-acetyltransferase
MFGKDTGMDNRRIIINQEEYALITDYRDTDYYRRSLNRLTRQTYGFDFEEWYRQGYWGDGYRPYSFLHNNEIIANVSANPIDFLIDGRLHHVLQIGTVMTDHAYRRRGLSRILLQTVLSEYEASCEMIYLYANDTVLDFYPRFGFTEAEEYIHTKYFREQEKKLPVRKLDMLKEADRALVLRLVMNTKPYSKYAMVDNPGLVMFYLTSFLAEEIYYMEELNLVAVAAYEEDNLLLTDLFCEKEVDMDTVINALVNKPEMKVTLGFTPADTVSFTAERVKEKGTTFFVRGRNLIDKGRFPVLSHA